jgi:hypothetical protein
MVLAQDAGIGDDRSFNTITYACVLISRSGMLMFVLESQCGCQSVVRVVSSRFVGVQHTALSLALVHQANLSYFVVWCFGSRSKCSD